MVRCVSLSTRSIYIGAGTKVQLFFVPDSSICTNLDF